MKQKTIGINPLEEYLSKGREQKEKANEADQKNEHDGQELVVPQSMTRELGSSILAEEPPHESENSDATPLILVGEPTSAPIEPEVQEPLKGKQRITLHISAHVIDRLKNAVYWEPGMTIAGFAEEALEDALNQMELERGKPFPARRQHRLKGGRPLI